MHTSQLHRMPRKKAVLKAMLVLATAVPTEAPPSGPSGTDERKIIWANAGNPRGLEPVELYRVDNDAGEDENGNGTLDSAVNAWRISLLQKSKRYLVRIEIGNSSRCFAKKRQKLMQIGASVPGVQHCCLG